LAQAAVRADEVFVDDVGVLSIESRAAEGRGLRFREW
jgi:hypothetical protein